MKRFGYDYTGTLPDNRFKESRTLLANENSDRVIILEHAPFFSKLVVTAGINPTPLKQGVDYELVHQLPQLEDIANDDLYCGVQILTPLIIGPIHFEGQTVGGDYVDGLNGILDKLVKYLNKPLVGDFEDVLNFPVLVPKLQTYREWTDLLNTQAIADTISGLGDSMDLGSDVILDALEALRLNIIMLAGIIDSFDYPSHIVSINPHETTATQLDAHPINLAVSDAFMAYSKDFYTLCDYIRAQGLSEQQLREYIGVYADGVIKGEFIFDDNAAIISSEDRSVRFDFTDGKVRIVSKGHLFFQADFDAASQGETYSLVSGINTLTITSTAGDVDPSMITLNGVELLNNRTIKEYQGGTNDGSTAMVHTESETMNIIGIGTLSDPLTAHLLLPEATEATDGIARIKNGSGPEGDGWVVAPSAVKILTDEVVGLVPRARLLNDKPFTGTGMTIGKADIKLGNVDNTSDMLKPLSDDLLAAVNALSLATHQHEWAELNIPHATPTKTGIALIANDVENLPVNQAVEPYVLNIVKQRIEALLPRYTEVIVTKELEFSTVDSSMFTVSSFRLTPTVPIEYGISKDGLFSRGQFSGIVDLSNIVNRDYMATENDCDLRWGKAVARPGTSLVPTHPSSIVIAPTSGWAPAKDVKFAVKKRINIEADTTVIISVISDDNSIIYVDGLEVGTSSAVGTEIFIELKKGRHTFAFMCNQSLANSPTAIAFSIESNGSILAASDNSWACSLLDTPEDPTNNHFYLYGEVATNNIVARAAAHNFGNVSTEYVFIGVVKTSYVAAIPNDGMSLSFKSTIDYGIFKEQSDHMVKTLAHGVGDDTGIVGLENVRGFDDAGGSTTLNTPCRVESTTPASTKIYRSITLTGANTTSRSDYRIVQHILGHCPARYHDIDNVLAGNMYTIEGILHCKGGDTDHTFLFPTDALNGIHTVLSIKYSETTKNFTFETSVMDELIPSSSPSTMTEMSFVKAVVPTKINNVDWQYTATPSALTDTRNEYKMLRYRYSPETNLLTLMCSTGGSYTVADFIFPMMLSGFFSSKIVGVEGSTNADGDAILGGVIDGFEIRYDDLKRVTNYRSLVECYLDGNDAAKYSENGNGLKHVEINTGIVTLLDSWHGATDITHVGQGVSDHFTTSFLHLPASFYNASIYTIDKRPKAEIDIHSKLPTNSPAVTITAGAKWVLGDEESITFSKEITATSTSVGFMFDVFGKVKISVENGSSWAGSVSGYVSFTNSLIVGKKYIINIEVFSSGGPISLNCLVSDPDNAFIKIPTDATWSVTRSLGKAGAMLHVNPWHTCQSAWDAVLSAINK